MSLDDIVALWWFIVGTAIVGAIFVGIAWVIALLLQFFLGR